MIEFIKNNLFILIEKILDDSIARKVEKVLIELISNLGEVKIYEFESVDEALNFLGKNDLKELFFTTDSFSLFDPPPEFNYE